MKPSNATKPIKPIRSRRSIQLQNLEDRRLLTTFGEAWPDARNLNVSFPDDTARIGSETNDVNQTLDQIADRADWQELALRAYQTWAVHTDINIGLRDDVSLNFGTPGLTVGDPRFGEFRIGAFAQEGSVANSVPFQATAGTYSGDLLLDSDQNLRFHDWANDAGPDPATIADGDRDLFSILLHEAGNTLGVADNGSDWTVMFGQYTVPKGVLAAEDIAAVQAIYGQRTDPYEQVDNGSIQLAQPVTITDSQWQDRPADLRGSLIAGSDVDVYELDLPSDTSQLSIRLRTEGISFLLGKLEVIDSTGAVIATQESDSVFANDAELQLANVDQTGPLWVRVSAKDPNSVYAVGDYVLEFTEQADFDVADDSWIDDVADLISTDPASTAHGDSQADYLSPDRFEFQSSISDSNDVDLLRVTAPANVGGRLVVHLADVDTDGQGLRLNVVDSAGALVGTAGRLRQDGTFAVEVAQPIAGADYYIRVSVDPSSSVSVGQYVAVAQFESTAASANELVSGDVASDVDEFFQWTAEKTRLFRFDLSASGGEAGDLVRLTIYDAHTREAKVASVTEIGMSRSLMVWLQQGDYIVRLSLVTSDFLNGGQHSGDPHQASFSLFVDGLSDDQDEDYYDHSTDPDLLPYEYEYHEPEYEYEYCYVEVYYDWDRYYDPDWDGTN